MLCRHLSERAQSRDRASPCFNRASRPGDHPCQRSISSCDYCRSVFRYLRAQSSHGRPDPFPGRHCGHRRSCSRRPAFENSGDRPHYRRPTEFFIAPAVGNDGIIHRGAKMRLFFLARLSQFAQDFALRHAENSVCDDFLSTLIRVELPAAGFSARNARSRKPRLTDV